MLICIRSLLLACLLMPTVLFAVEPAKQPITLSSSAFLDEGVLPVVYTCDGKDISPQIAWDKVPANTKSLALIISDPTAPKGVFYHWVLFNLPAKAMEVPEAMTPAVKGAVIGQNDFGKTQYNGPCPPKGSAHSYVFTVYALDTMLTLKKGAMPKDVLDAMQKHIVDQAHITAVYSRWILEK